LSWRRSVPHRPIKLSTRALHSALLSSPMQPTMESDGVPLGALVLLTSTSDRPARSPTHFGQPARQSAIQATRPWSARRRAAKTGRHSHHSAPWQPIHFQIHIFLCSYICSFVKLLITNEYKLCYILYTI